MDLFEMVQALKIVIMEQSTVLWLLATGHAHTKIHQEIAAPLCVPHYAHLDAFFDEDDNEFLQTLK